MKKFIVLVDVGLNANDEYGDYMENVFIEIIEAKNEKDALEVAKSNVTPEDVKELSGFADNSEYDIHVKEV